MQQILKSSIDSRVYKSIQLGNKMLCLLISDKNTEKSAAALNVDVGSLCDPVERMGLAHFCEHMLFMGTEKYPSESEYSEYISKNSGTTNAYTSELNTNFIFQVSNNAFEGALDRFAQFFISPLFSESCTEREMKAVDSEYNMNLQNDFWRKFQLVHNIALPGSTYNKFMIGNLKTLQFPDTRQYLLDFHTKYYSSNIMRLVVYGSQPIEQLEEWTQSKFAGIPNKDLPSPKFADHPYNETNLGKLIKFVPIKDMDYLELNWIIDDLQPHYENCPGKYISHLLGHEGKGSLLSQLIKEDLAQELSCGPNNNMKLFSDMNVRIKLTKNGLKNYKKIIEYVFQYIEMLKQKATQKWIFEETQKVKQLQFNFLEKQQPFDYVSTLAARLQLYPVNEVLAAPYLMKQFNEDLIKKTISSLTNKNLIVLLSSQEFNGTLGNKEFYFGTEYVVEDFHIENQTVIHPSLDLPEQNIYIPEHTNLLEPGIKAYPELVFENEQTSIWFKQDDVFRVPKTAIQLRVYTNDLGFGRLASTEVLARIWHGLLKNHIRELNYLAEMAHIDPQIQLAVNGLEISVTGFSDSLQRFLVGMFKNILSFGVQEYQNQYESVYLKVQQELQNFKRQPPYQQVHSLISVLLRDGGSFDPEELLRVLKLIKYEDLLHFQEKFLRTCRFEWLIMGNLHAEEAKNIGLSVQKLFNASVLPKEQVLQIRGLHLGQNPLNYSYKLQEPTETNSAVVLHYQHETGTLRSQVINDILHTMLKSPFFQQLRTVEQLGYAVFSLVSDIRGVQGFNFLIQSNAQSPQYCQDRVKIFLNDKFQVLVSELKNEQFDEYRESVRVQLTEKDYSLNKEAGRFWLEVQKHQALFNRRAQQLEILPTITKEEVQNYFLEHFIKNPKTIEIHAISPTHTNEGVKSVVFSSIEQIKRRVPLYPDYYSLL